MYISNCGKQYEKSNGFKLKKKKRLYYENNKKPQTLEY